MRWDPTSTLQKALWIGGGQWAGKSTVAGILADRHDLVHYHYDYHDARGHWDRHQAALARRGEPVADPDPEAAWIRSTVDQAVERSLRSFVERFAFVEDDLRALASPRPIIAEGWGLRPELVAPIAGSPRHMIVLVPTEEFRQHQLSHDPRAVRFGRQLSDPAKAQVNRLARDRRIAADAVAQAGRLGIRVLEIDGSSDAEQVADLVADHFHGLF